MPTLTTSEAKRLYDRFGAKQDKQDFYEAPAIAFLLAPVICIDETGPSSALAFGAYGPW